jgi:hypothetical protein
VQLWSRTYNATWATIESTRPTWGSGATAGTQWDTNTWQQIEETGL